MSGSRLRDAITRRVVRFLTRPVARGEHTAHNDLELLTRHIRKGDVLLVEGDQRVSLLVKYLTHSSWSHAALYVGDELVRRGGALRDLAREHFGEEADRLVVEALVDGVVASPLSKYEHFNVRICRPHRLRAPHLRAVLDEAIEAIGLRYDLRNVLQLALHLVLASLLPSLHRGAGLRLGSGAPNEVICTSLIGRVFHRVGFPVRPTVSSLEEGAAAPRRRRGWGGRKARYDGLYTPRHSTLLMPRDFDLSPYFDVVKFNVIGQRGFDYERISWAADPTREGVA